MHPYRLRNYLREHPGGTFPKFRILDAAEIANYRNDLRNTLGLKVTDSDEVLYSVIVDCLSPRHGLLATDEGFSLSSVICAGPGFDCSDCFIEWDDGMIDCFAIADVVKHFDDIWYPGPDEVFFIDANLIGIAAVDYYGNVYTGALTSSRHH